jgi:chemotaxis signal transduction protein
MPTHIKGVINLRGTVIAVLDLRAKFKLAAKSYGERTASLSSRSPRLPAAAL